MYWQHHTQHSNRALMLCCLSCLLLLLLVCRTLHNMVSRRFAKSSHSSLVQMLMQFWSSSMPVSAHVSFWQVVTVCKTDREGADHQFTAG
jgi:hypothetical protein